jgi:hypothetical protein
MHMGVCCSHYSYPVSIFLVLSQFRLEGKVVISYVNPNFKKAGGATAAAAAATTDGTSSEREPVEVEAVDPYSKTTAYNYANTQDEREDERKPTTAYCEIDIKNEAFKSVNVRSSFDGCSGAEERVQSKVDDKLTRAFKYLVNNPIRFAIKPPQQPQPPQNAADRKQQTTTTSSSSSTASTSTTAATSTASTAATASPPQHKTQTDSATGTSGSTYYTSTASPEHPPLPAPILIPVALPSSSSSSAQSLDDAETAGGLRVTAQRETSTGTVTHYSFAAPSLEDEAAAGDAPFEAEHNAYYAQQSLPPADGDF